MKRTPTQKINDGGGRINSHHNLMSKLDKIHPTTVKDGPWMHKLLTTQSEICHTVKMALCGKSGVKGIYLTTNEGVTCPRCLQELGKE